VIAFLLAQYYKSTSDKTPLSKEILDLIKEESRSIIALRLQSLIDAISGDFGSPNDSRESLGGQKGLDSWERTLMRYETNQKVREHVINKYHEAVRVFETALQNTELSFQNMERGNKVKQMVDQS